MIAVQNPRSSSYYSSAYGSSYAANRASASSYSPTYVRSAARPSSMSLSSLISEVRLQRDIMPYSCRGRTGKSMSPRYITIHSTQNWSQGADALRHSLALKRSKLGRVSWHFTTDDRRAVQHLPTSEQGNHAENWDGPGNRYSIGIEMCEHPGNSRSATLDRTAKLAAYLMVKHNIPLSRVVPHYKWYRKGHNPPHKNCPHFLMTNGRPGAKWKAFLAKVNRYSIEVRGGQTIYASR
ncbi:MAG: N-acetylmuramoyl-L-alanine amidase [Verrucomicrobiota bacterium]